MHSLTLKAPPFLPNFNPETNQLNSTNLNLTKSQFNSFKCFTNSNPKPSPIMFRPSSQFDRILKTQLPNQPNSNSNFTNPLNQSLIHPRPSSQIDRIAKTHFPNHPNSTPTLTKHTNYSPIHPKPISQFNQIVETHFPNQHNSTPSLTKNTNNSPILSKPISQFNQIVETQFPKSPNSNPSLRKPIKIQFLSSEFKALPEPIDRVKRLLQYATLLSPIHETGRIESSKVTGCTTQVWLEAEIDSEGLMRFRADSDSEITKGFCYCLVWALNGLFPEEVLAVAVEDLAEMNVGFSGKSKHSRVNTWQNVLLGMQRRTEALAEERERGERVREGERMEGFSAFGGQDSGFPQTEERLLIHEVAQLS